MMIIMEFVSGLVILIPETLWRIRFCNKVVLSYKKRRVLRAFPNTSRKKCRHQRWVTSSPYDRRATRFLCLGLCPNFPFWRSDNWIKENVTGNQERRSSCLYTCARDMLSLIITRKSNFLKGCIDYCQNKCISHIGKRVEMETRSIRKRKIKDNK